MRRPSIILALVALTSSLSLFAAAPVAAPSTHLLVLKGVSEETLGPFLSASERMVWDRQTGTLVADVPDVALPSLPEGVAAGVCGGVEPFSLALSEELPGFVMGAPVGERYVTKEPATLVKPARARQRPDRPSENRAEDVCLSENFENTPIWTENGGLWWHYQGGQPYNAAGDYYWLDTNCDAFDGSWDCEAIMGGTLGETLPCGAYYDYNTDSWLEFAPWITCLNGAPGAYLDFYGKLYTQTGIDYFYYLVSLDGQDYTGYRISGSLYNTWYRYDQNLRAWTGLGDLTTVPQFALAFVFQSGQNIPQNFIGWGVRLDKISINTTSLSIASVNKMSSPFRLGLSGGGFLPGAQIYIDGVRTPGVSYKSPSQMVAKGGDALKAMLPKGQPVCITVVNPNGGTTPCYSYTR
jgi:hypothetical protein